MEIDTYRKIVESSPDFICAFLPDTTITFANEALCRTLEAEREELPGRPFLEMIPESEIAPAKGKIAALTPESPSVSHRMVFPLSKGEEYVVQWNIQGHFSPRGELQEVYAFGRDDSERTKATVLLAKGARREKLAARIISDYAFCKSWDEFDTITNRTLKLLGTENQVDRANLFRFPGDSVSKTHEWCARGVPSQKELLQGLSRKACDWWIETIERDGAFYFLDPKELPKRLHVGKGSIETLNIRSLVVFPLEAEGSLKGVLSLENFSKNMLSPETDFSLLASISRVIGKTVALLEAEEELRAAKHMYQDIVEKQSELIVRIAPDWKISFCNHAFARYFDTSPDEFVGKNIATMIPEGFEHLRKLTPQSPECTSERRVLMTDGSARWQVWHDIAFFDDRGALKEIQAVGWDITELVTAQQAHENERKRALTLFENSPEGILASWDGVRIHEVNHAFCRMTGFPRGEVMGRPLREVFSRDARSSSLNIERLLARTISGESAVEEGTLATKAGKRLFLSLLALPVPDAGERDKGMYIFFRNLTALKEKEAQLLANIEKLNATFFQTVEVLAQTVESRDPYTAGHQRRTALLSFEIARRMALDDDVCQGIFLAAAIHDVGKISVPSEILSRPGRLLEVEFALVRTHAEEGYNILKKVDFPWKIPEIVRQHHERLDGSGYPHGLKEGEILLEAKIIAVADTVEAMASHRPYRPTLGIEAALRFIEEGKGRLFDETVVDACRNLFAEKGSFEELDAVAEFLNNSES